jgi:hypothetical protein
MAGSRLRRGSPREIFRFSEECCGAFWVGFSFYFFRSFLFFSLRGCWFRDAIHLLSFFVFFRFYLLYARRLIETQPHQQGDAARYDAPFCRAFLYIPT